MVNNIPLLFQYCTATVEDESLMEMLYSRLKMTSKGRAFDKFTKKTNKIIEGYKNNILKKKLNSNFPKNRKLVTSLHTW